MKVARHSVTATQFVTIYVTSKNEREAARRLTQRLGRRVGVEEVKAGANFYERQGVRLKAA